MKHAVQDFKHPPHERFLSRLNKVLIVLTICAATIPLSNYAIPGLAEKVAQDIELALLEEELEVAQTVNTRLVREVAALVNNDSEYLAMFARDRVDPGYMADGETIFRLPQVRNR